MNNVSFEYLEKGDFDRHAESLFSIMHENMSSIAPTGCTYEEDLAAWKSKYGSAFKNRPERKTVLMVNEDREIVGFFGYCEEPGTFSMEEIQINPEYQGRNGIFRRLYVFVVGNLPKDLRHVEAYAHKKNFKSLAILNKFGLKIVGANPNGSLYHLYGAYEDFLSWLNKE